MPTLWTKLFQEFELLNTAIFIKNAVIVFIRVGLLSLLGARISCGNKSGPKITVNVSIVIPPAV